MSLGFYGFMTPGLFHFLALGFMGAGVSRISRSKALGLGTFLVCS